MNQITPRHLYEIAILIFVGLVLHAYISSSNGLSKFNQAKEDAAPIQAVAKQEGKAAVADEGANQKALTKALQDIANQKKQPINTQVDYARIEDMINKRIGGTPARVEANPQLPDAPNAVVPAKNLRDYMSDCDALKADFGSCKTSVANKQRELDAEKTDHSEDKKKLDAAAKALKGGNFFQRLNHDKNVLVVGGVIGAVVTVVVSQKFSH